MVQLSMVQHPHPLTTYCRKDPSIAKKPSQTTRQASAQSTQDRSSSRSEAPSRTQSRHSTVPSCPSNASRAMRPSPLASIASAPLMAPHPAAQHTESWDFSRVPAIVGTTPQYHSPLPSFYSLGTVCHLSPENQAIVDEEARLYQSQISEKHWHSRSSSRTRFVLDMFPHLKKERLMPAEPHSPVRPLSDESKQTRTSQTLTSPSHAAAHTDRPVELLNRTTAGASPPALFNPEARTIQFSKAVKKRLRSPQTMWTQACRLAGKGLKSVQHGGNGMLTGAWLGWQEGLYKGATFEQNITARVERKGLRMEETVYQRLNDLGHDVAAWSASLALLGGVVHTGLPVAQCAGQIAQAPFKAMAYGHWNILGPSTTTWSATTQALTTQALHRLSDALPKAFVSGVTQSTPLAMKAGTMASILQHLYRIVGDAHPPKAGILGLFQQTLKTIDHRLVQGVSALGGAVVHALMGAANGFSSAAGYCWRRNAKPNAQSLNHRVERAVAHQSKRLHQNAVKFGARALQLPWQRAA